MGEILYTVVVLGSATGLVAANARNAAEHPDLRVAYVWYCAGIGALAGLAAGYVLGGGR